MPAAEIGARYRLEQVAGTGGMATVWRAHDTRLKRTVAIKIMSDTLAANPTAVARFAREARTHAKIQHPNLVQVYDYSVTATQPYLVMEYIDGATLSERLDRGGTSPAPSPTLARELLSALACVHDHGVLHRDIKPANVLLDAADSARLTDFGLARLEDSSRVTHPDEVVGTLRFLAPELLEGKPSTRQSDLFALGVLLRTATGDRRALPEIEELIKWLTQPSPHARPRDAHAALTALAPTPRRQPPSAPPPGRNTPPRGRNAPPPGRNTAPRGRNAAPRGRNTPPPGRKVQKARPAETGRGAEGLRVRTGHRARGNQLRNRLLAVSALAVAAVGTTLAVTESGGGASSATAGSKATTIDRQQQASIDRQQQASIDRQQQASIDRRLQALASSVRRAATP